MARKRVGKREFVIRSNGPDGEVPHFYADTDLMKLTVVNADYCEQVEAERDGLHKLHAEVSADKFAVEQQRDEAVAACRKAFAFLNNPDRSDAVARTQARIEIRRALSQIGGRDG